MLQAKEARVQASRRPRVQLDMNTTRKAVEAQVF